MALNEKTKKWLNKQNISFEGKTVLVTGANSGIGYKTVETAIYLGAEIIMACRNIEKAEAARENLLKDYPDSKISIMKLDISDFSSIDAFANEVISNKIDIDVFVNNAGTFHRKGITKDGFESVIGTNYFGVYRLTEALLPYFKSLPHKVHYFNTISLVYKCGKISFDDFYYSEKYNHFAVYARSKLCLAKYTYYLAQKYQNTNLFFYMIHPGTTITALAAGGFSEFIKNAANAFRWIFNSPEKSSLEMVYVLANDLPSGSIAGPRIFEVWGYPKENRVRKIVKEGAEELLSFTEAELKF